MMMDMSRGKGLMWLLLLVLFKRMAESQTIAGERIDVYNLKDLGSAQKSSGKKWRPERAIDSELDAWQAVEAEVWRSLERYDELVEDESLFETIIERCGEKLVLVLNGRLFVTPQFDSDWLATKSRLHLAMMYSILQKKWGGLPDALYLINLGARGEDPVALAEEEAETIGHTKKCSHKLPFLVIAKKMGYESPGLMIPNPYFDDLTTWQRDRERSDNAIARQWPWHRRIPKLYWRGEISCHTDCFGDMGNYRRWNAVIQSWLHPDLLDVKLSVVNRDKRRKQFFVVRNSTSDAVVPIPKSSTDKGNVLEQAHRGDCSIYGMPTTANMKKSYAQLHKDPWVFADSYVSHDSFVQHQFLLNLPGQAGGSYSRNLNYIWSLGGIIFLWDAHFTEWYFPALRTGLTHLVVDESSVVDVVRMIKANATLATDLRWHARRIYDTFVSPNALADFMRFVLGVLQKKFPLLTHTLNDKIRLNSIIKRHKCGTDAFPLAEITRGTGAKSKSKKLQLRPIQPNDPDLPACVSDSKVVRRLSTLSFEQDDHHQKRTHDFNRRNLFQGKGQVAHHPELSSHAPFCYQTPLQDEEDTGPEGSGLEQDEKEINKSSS